MANAYIVVGLGFGDEGKGSWVDSLARKHDIRYTLRFNGGAQALHHVVTPQGVEHGFSQFGSATFVGNTKTILSRFMLIEPLSLIKEANILQSKGVQNPFDRLLISENAPIITMFHIFLNRCKETSRGVSRHGSCGLGIGETQQDIESQSEKVIYMKDLRDPIVLKEKLLWLYNQKLSIVQSISQDNQSNFINDFLNFNIEDYCDLLHTFSLEVQTLKDEDIQKILCENDVIFEGAQGVLLDQQYGFFPYCTRSNTTFQNALELLSDCNCNIIKIGLLRAYGTRHGAGPFVTQDDSLKISQCHNSTGPWQGDFRVGWFDAVLARYALNITGALDVFAITNIDRLFGFDSLKIANSYTGGSSSFPDGEIPVIPVDYTRLEKRTLNLENTQAEYIVTEGFSSSTQESFQEYLNLLSELVNHKIHAISLTPCCKKVYL